MYEEAGDGVYKYCGEGSYYKNSIAILKRAATYVVYIEFNSDYVHKNCNYSTGFDDLAVFDKMFEEGKWKRVTNISK